ncbi:putative Reverse transcriptase (RNA dependent DNA polymerase) [Trypanosoma vivax]|nr:putative Reverse transcriptase (RNA dependent DNA polymerase) [Trypanosoma vivax]
MVTAVSLPIDRELAFDSVDRGCVLKALLSFAVKKHLVAWFVYFLQGSTARALVIGALSEDVILPRGVPRGSVLEPLLFIVAVDSLSRCLTLSLRCGMVSLRNTLPSCARVLI